MNKKSTLILLSILHICILGICILTIYTNKNRASEAMIAHVSSDTKTMDSQTEPAVETNPGQEIEPGTETEPGTEAEPGTEIEPETNAAAEPDTDAIPEPETETAPETNAETEPSPVYYFHYIGTRSKLNIRSAPSTDDTIIGKVPCGGDGSVLELTNDEWALIEYQGIIGYCSRKFLKLKEPDNNLE